VGDAFGGTVTALRGGGFSVCEERPDEEGSALRAALVATWRLRGQLRRARGVVVECGSNDLPAFWCAALAVTLRRDLVLVAHDPPKIARAPGAAIVRREGTWRLRVAYRILSPVLDRWLIGRVLDRAGALVVLGAPAREALERATRRPVLSAPHGMRVPAPPRLPPSRCDYVLFAGFLAPAKGVDVLIRAWAYATGIALRLRIAGAASSGQESWVEDLRRESAQLENAPEWVGPVREAVEFDALFQHAAIVVLPYRTSSPASGILVRAMAAGRCVIASRVRACTEVLQDGVSGVLLDVEDQAGLTRALERLAADPAQRDRLGAAALQRATEVFGWDKFVAVLEQALVQARTS